MIIGIITLTGVGLKFSTLVVALSGGNLLLALVLTMVTCLVLGMGLPTAAAYILVATLVAPALVNLGVGLLAAHLFVLYSAMLSSITPPVALAAYAAASLSKANPMRVAIQACKFGMAAFVVPYFFIYDPAILGQDVSAVTTVLSFVTAIAGGICASAAIMGYFSNPLNLSGRISVASADSKMHMFDWRMDLAGAVLFIALVLLEKKRAAASAPHSKEPGTIPEPLTQKGE